MPNYSFKETIDFFGEKLHAVAPVKDVESGAVELILDGVSTLLSKGVLEGSMKMEIGLGFLGKSMEEEQLNELVISNFLGVRTGGCTVAFDDKDGVLYLLMHITPGTTPQESFESLNRIFSVAYKWSQMLRKWEGFIVI